MAGWLLLALLPPPPPAPELPFELEVELDLLGGACEVEVFCCGGADWVDVVVGVVLGILGVLEILEVVEALDVVGVPEVEVEVVGEVDVVGGGELVVVGEEVVAGMPPVFGPLDGELPETVRGGGTTYENSVDEVAVPPQVVTDTVTVLLPGGDVTVIEVAVSAVTVAAAEPKSTAVAFSRLDPVIVTGMPPVAGPLDGEMPETLGRGPVCAAAAPAGISVTPIAASPTTSDGVQTRNLNPSRIRLNTGVDLCISNKGAPMAALRTH